jgi:hypothetical protein
MARYGKKAQKKVERAMHEMKRGELKSGRSGKRVTSRKQAIAIGLSEARKAGGKVPAARSSRTRRTRKSSAKKSSRWIVVADAGTASSRKGGDTEPAARAARAAGLVYVSDRDPGFSRVRCGKGFRYLRPDGQPLRAAAQLRRIASLAIPPAYEQVWICRQPRAPTA